MVRVCNSLVTGYVVVMNLLRPRDLSAIVRGSRMDQGLSQDELARRAGVSRKTVNEVERGATDPRLSIMLAILDALGITLDARRSDTDATSSPASESLHSKIDLDRHLGAFDVD